MSSNELRSRRSRYSDKQYENSSIYNGSVKSSLNNFSIDLPQNRKKMTSIEKELVTRQNLNYKTIINLTNTKYPILQQISGPEHFNWKVQNFGQTKHWTIKWCDTGMTNEALQKMHYLQKINHFPSMSVIARKNSLAMTLTKMKEQFPKEYNFYPRTFLYPKESSNVLHYYVESRKKGLLKTFIIKPEAGCQGRGIFLTQNYAQIQKQQQCVIQKYISNPLLYQGLKFDLRIYVLLSSCNPLRIHLYNQGLVRFATDKYQFPVPANLNNLFMHLTNYAINKSNPTYEYNYSVNDMAYGHKKSLAQFFKILKDLGYKAGSYWNQIKDCIIKTLIAAQPFISYNYKACRPHDSTSNMCFEVLGFDFMIDNRDQCFLLQVNHTPSFSTDTPLDHIIKKNLIKDTLQMMNPSYEEIKLREELQRSKQRDKYVKFKNGNQNYQFQRQTLIKQINRIRHNHEQTYKGTYDLIYPSKNTVKQSNYERLIAASARNSNFTNQATTKSAYSTSNLRSMLVEASSQNKISSKQNLAKINEKPEIPNKKKSIVYNYNYLKSNIPNKKALSTLPTEMTSNKKDKFKSDKFMRANSSQKLKTQMTIIKEIQQAKEFSQKKTKYQYVPQSYKSEQKRYNYGIQQQSRQRIKTLQTEEKANINQEINSFTKRIRAYKTPLM